MATANKIAAFRPIQPTSRPADDSTGIHGSELGSQAKVAGLGLNQQIIGPNGQRGENLGEQRNWFLSNGALGESLRANWSGVSTCARGSMQPSKEAMKLSGSASVLSAMRLRPVNCPTDFSSQIARGRFNAHVQHRSGARMDAFKANPSQFRLRV
jgi:hypothetical protein